MAIAHKINNYGAETFCNQYLHGKILNRNKKLFGLPPFARRSFFNELFIISTKFILNYFNNDGKCQDVTFDKNQMVFNLVGFLSNFMRRGGRSADDLSYAAV